MIRDNLGTKVLAVALGVVLWVYAIERTNPRAETTVLSEVSVEEVPQGLSCVPSPLRVEVELSGPGDKIALLRRTPQAVTVTARAKDLPTGEHQVPVRTESLSAGVRVRAIHPSVVRLRLEPLQEKTLRLVLAPSGSPPPDYDPTQVVLHPTEVRLRGLPSEVDRVASASVEVNLPKLAHDGRAVAAITFQDAMGNRISPSLASVEPVWVAVSVEAAQKQAAGPSLR